MKLYINWKLPGHTYTMTCNVESYAQEKKTKQSIIKWIQQNKNRIIDWSFENMDTKLCGHRERFERLITKTLK